MSAEAKARMRGELREARRAFVSTLSPEDRRGAFTGDCRELAVLIARANVTAVYIAMCDEADPSPIAMKAREGGSAICLPRLETGGAMRFASWDGSAQSLAPGQLSIPQPDTDAPEAAPDLIIVPMLGFDRTLARIGQGKGYYDRALAALPRAFRLGLAWSAQEVARIPIDTWDTPLHAVLTEREWIGATP